jgi:hypothetical protein
MRTSVPQMAPITNYADSYVSGLPHMQSLTHASLQRRTEVEISEMREQLQKQATLTLKFKVRIICLYMPGMYVWLLGKCKAHN